MNKNCFLKDSLLFLHLRSNYIEILKTRTYIFLLLCTLFVSCTGNWERWVDTSDDKVKILRYDEVVDDFVSLNSYSALMRLNTEFSLQTSMLIEDVLAIGSVQDPGIDRKLRAFYRDSIVQSLYREVRRQYGDLDTEEGLLYDAFTALKEADSTFVVPTIYTQVCALNESIIINDSVIGVGLDKYLGADFPLYKNYYYTWQRRSMERDQIVSDILFYYLADQYDAFQNRTLLDRIIFAGKMHWIIASLLDKPLYEEMNFSGDRLKWCVDHEKEVWRSLKNSKLLESTDWVRTMEFIEPRECTPTFGKESSDQLGLWLGAQIVDSYMKHNKNVQWQELLHTDSKIIYQNSGYNP